MKVLPAPMMLPEFAFPWGALESEACLLQARLASKNKAAHASTVAAGLRTCDSNCCGWDISVLLGHFSVGFQWDDGLPRCWMNSWLIFRWPAGKSLQNMTEASDSR